MTGLREQLQAIYDRDGALTPASVLTEATPDESPLHDRFEWNDTVAGHRYRLIQARALIRSVRVVYAEDETEQKTTRAFVATYGLGDHEKEGYLPTETALADEFTGTLILRACEREIIALRRRYGHLAEFRDLLRRHLDDGDAA